MRHKKYSLAVFAVLATLSQPLSAQELPTVRSVHSVFSPTERNFAYPQSLFVDSPNGNIWVTDFDNNRVMRFDVSSLTNVFEVASLNASQYHLGQNYPNPFNPSTAIPFVLPNAGHVTVTVYDALGRKILRLFDGMAAAHTMYVLRFDGSTLSSGIYFYSLRAEAIYEVRKMGLIK